MFKIELKRNLSVRRQSQLAGLQATVSIDD